MKTETAPQVSIQSMVRLRLMPTNLREANDFVVAHHRHNGRTARNGGKWAVAALAWRLLSVNPQPRNLQP